MNKRENPPATAAIVLPEAAKNPAIATLAPLAAAAVVTSVAFNLAMSALKPNTAPLLAVSIDKLAPCTLLKAAVAAPSRPWALAS